MVSLESDERSPKITESTFTREDFWNVLAIEQDQIATEYEKAIQDLLSLEEPMSNVQSVVNRMHDQTLRYRVGLKRKDAEIKEKEEKIDKLTKTLEKYKNSITIDQKISLEEDLTKLQKQVDVSHIREQDLQETVDYLRKQVKTLETAIEQKEVEAAELDADLELMGRTREGMQKEKEKMKRVMLQTEAMVNTANAEREEYSRLYQSSKGIIDDLRKQFSEKIAEAEELALQTTESEATINDLRKNYDEIANSYESLYDAYMDCFKQLAVHRETNQELAAGLEELYKENEEYEENEKTLKRKINVLRVRIGASEQRFAELTADYEAQCKEVEKLTADVRKLKNVASQQPTPKKQTSVSVSKGIPAVDVLHLKQFVDSEIHHLEKVIKEKDKKLVDLKNNVDALHAEKKVMAETLSKTIGVNSDLQDQIKSQADALTAMDTFLTDARQQLRECKSHRDALEREKRKYQQEKSRLISKLNDTTEAAHSYEEQLMMTRRQLVERTMQLKREKNNVEVVKAERNSQHAKWQETKSLLQDQSRICKIEATQIQQLKEEVATRDKQLTKEHLALKKLSTKYNSIVLYESKLEKKIEEMKNETMKFEALKKKFENEKKEDEKETQAIMKRQAKYQKEMANISTMLDRRLVELSLLYEKIDLLNNMLRQGETQYKERIEDIRLLKLEVKRLRYQNQVLQATFKNMADLRHEIFHLNRDLATERQKCHALQEELETPINFHRWRILQGTDPDKRNLIDKVQILQKKLLKEVEARALEKERFKDLEAVYLQLKKKLVSLPGSDIQGILNNTKKALKDKIEENKVLETTLSACEGEMQDYKYRLEQLHKQHDELKTKFFNQKRVRDKTKMKHFEERNSQEPEPVDGKIVLGGGFRVETT